MIDETTPDDDEPAPIDWSQCNLVQSHPDYMSGAWCLRSAPRMPADTIVANWDDGCSIEELSEMWEGITREQIEGILQFARADGLVVEYDDMAPSGQAIVDAGLAKPAGAFPTGLTRDELLAWITKRFSAKP
jgi:uncharacterized protein (DUF433 family)